MDDVLDGALALEPDLGAALHVDFDQGGVLNRDGVLAIPGDAVFGIVEGCAVGDSVFADSV